MTAVLWGIPKARRRQTEKRVGIMIHTDITNTLDPVGVVA